MQFSSYKDPNLIIPLIIFITVIVSYFGGVEAIHMKFWGTIVVPTILIVSSYKFIKLDVIFFILLVNVILGLGITLSYDTISLSDLLHIVSYNILVFATYLSSFWLLHNLDIKLLYNLILVYFSILVLHHLFVYLGIGEGTYFWDLQFLSQRNIDKAVFSNIGNGKQTTALVTSFTLVAVMFSKFSVKYKYAIGILIIIVGALSFSRTFLFVAAIAYLLYESYNIFIKHTNRYRLPMVLGLSSLMIIINWELFSFVFLREEFSDITKVSRYQQFLDYLDIIGDHLLFGTGWTALESTIGRYLDVGFAEIGVITFVVEQGLIRSLTYLSIIFFSAVSSILIIYKQLSEKYIAVLMISFISIVVGVVWGNNITSNLRAFLFWLGLFNFINVYKLQLKHPKKFLRRDSRCEYFILYRR